MTRTLLAFALLLPSLLSAQATFTDSLCRATLALTEQQVVYDPSYFAIDYPGGDVPPDRGVCTDVVIRAYRQLGIDLQQQVHEDMRANFTRYPQRWGLSRPDPNIDHRRVPNLMTFFARHGGTAPLSDDPAAYCPGDVVCWDLGGGVLHIGMLVDRRSGDGQRWLVVHNIGGGQVLADCLFQYEVIGHYRYGR